MYSSQYVDKYNNDYKKKNQKLPLARFAKIAVIVLIISIVIGLISNSILQKPHYCFCQEDTSDSCSEFRWRLFDNSSNDIHPICCDSKGCNSKGCTIENILKCINYFRKPDEIFHTDFLSNTLTIFLTSDSYALLKFNTILDEWVLFKILHYNHTSTSFNNFCPASDHLVKQSSYEHLDYEEIKNAQAEQYDEAYEIIKCFKNKIKYGDIYMINSASKQTLEKISVFKGYYDINCEKLIVTIECISREEEVHWVQFTYAPTRYQIKQIDHCVPCSCGDISPSDPTINDNNNILETEDDEVIIEQDESEEIELFLSNRYR